jgi:hypothetical protein
MDQIDIDRERRRQLALERLGSNCPMCNCGEDDPRCLQLRPKQKTNANNRSAVICRNCRCKQFPLPKSARVKAGKTCIVCTEADPRCLEFHHIAGRAFAGECVIVCSNCHAKLSDMQKGSSRMNKPTPDPIECIQRFLSGIADLFELLVPKLREFARDLGPVGGMCRSSLFATSGRKRIGGSNGICLDQARMNKWTTATHRRRSRNCSKRCVPKFPRLANER